MCITGLAEMADNDILLAGWRPCRAGHSKCQGKIFCKSISGNLGKALKLKFDGQLYI